MITDLSIAKLNNLDPRYPDPIEGRPFTDVYLLTATIDGHLKECPFFVNGEMASDQAANMLKVFASAIAK